MVPKNQLTQTSGHENGANGGGQAACQSFWHGRDAKPGPKVQPVGSRGGCDAYPSMRTGNAGIDACPRPAMRNEKGFCMARIWRGLYGANKGMGMCSTRYLCRIFDGHQPHFPHPHLDSRHFHFKHRLFKGTPKVHAKLCQVFADVCLLRDIDPHGDSFHSAYT